MTSLIGESVKRVEDQRFITGGGRYTDDIVLPGMCFAAVVRSPHAHAEIRGIDTTTARAAEGVVGVFTGQDIHKDGIIGVPTGWQVDFKNGDTMKEPPYPALADGKVRYAGNAVAVVVAETAGQAKDAAELVEVDYNVLPTVTDLREAIQEGAPQLFDDVPNNIPFDWELGDKAKTDAAFSAAEHITTLDFTNQRLIANAIEPRCSIGEWNPATDQFTLYTTSQNPHVTRLLLCAFAMGIPEHKVRVVAPDIGGGFGSKIPHYIEEVLVVWCAKQVGRPVKWLAERSESFVSDSQGREHLTHAELALKRDGTIMGMRVQTLAGMGAYYSTFAPCVPTYLHGTLLQGLYTTPAIHIDLTAVFTNTTPVDAYRGAGRPEATYLIERLVDQAAHELEIDPAELRSRNFIPAFDGVNQPGYETQVALTYDSGDYHEVLRRAKEMAGYDALRKEQARARAEGRYIGIGISTYIEACGIAPSAVVGALGARAGLYESAGVRVEPTGKISVFVGSHAQGQGHETTFAQVVAERLGIDMADVEIVHGDTGSVPFGMGTYGSRSLAVGGSAIVKSVNKIIDKATKIAAHLLEAGEQDLEFSGGKWTVKGTDKSIPFADVSLAAYVPHQYPEGLEPGLDETSFYDPVNFTFPYGAHIAVVEVDVDTGKVTLNRFIACDDVGNVVNPMVVDGQIHGGIAQGVGQALLEGAIYDESAQLVTASYMDYAMPRADDLPSYETDRTVTPCPHNDLGVKGVGEAGTIGSTAAVSNALIDALWSLGVRHVEMPFTPERVWRAIQEAKSA